MFFNNNAEQETKLKSEEDRMDKDKFNNMLSEQQEQANELIAKWL